MGNLILSILTPAIPSRMGQAMILATEINRQIGVLAVEHLVLTDNKRRTVGEKRDALLRASRGLYVAFVDDDDWIAPNYVAKICESITFNPDVITFLQSATVNGDKGIVEFRLGNENEAFKPNSPGVTKRNAWHICAWRRSLAIQSQFPASNYGEDWAFAAPLCAIPNLREAHIDEVLHFYNHSAETTEAPCPT